MQSLALVRLSPAALSRLAGSVVVIVVALLMAPPIFGLSVARADDASFAGTWDTQTDKGWHYDMVLKQSGNHVSGSYVAREDGSKGKIKGTVQDNTLSFNWTQSGFTGDGQFALSDDGNSFSGIYNADDNPQLTADFQHGKWTGTRKSGNTDTAAGTASFAGIVQVTSDKGWAYVFTIVQNGASVQGSYFAVSNGLKDQGLFTGKVYGQTMKFRWQQGEFTGKGQFTLKANREITGTYTGNPNPKLPPEYLSGTYEGKLINQ